MKAEVENSERLLQSASGLRRIFAEMKQACSEEVQKAEQLHRETEQELAHSRQMLQRAASGTGGAGGLACGTGGGRCGERRSCGSNGVAQSCGHGSSDGASPSGEARVRCGETCV